MRPIIIAAAVVALFALAVPAIAQATPACSTQTAAEAPKIVPNYSAGREAWLSGKLSLAAAHFRPLAEDGDAKAQTALGQILMQGGCGVTANKAEAANWLRKAAEAHDTTAEHLYAMALMNGDGVPQDDASAFTWAKRSAEAGVSQAQVTVGYLYSTGRGVKKNRQQGIRWAVMAAEQGAPVALSNLAKSYSSGDGVPKDLHRAMFLIATALQRVPPSQWQLSQRFLQTRYTIAHQLSVEDTKKIEQDAEKWSPGKGSLADVLADSEKWSAAGTTPGLDTELADH